MCRCKSRSAWMSAATMSCAGPAKALRFGPCRTLNRVSCAISFRSTAVKPSTDHRCFETALRTKSLFFLELLLDEPSRHGLLDRAQHGKGRIDQVADAQPTGLADQLMRINRRQAAAGRAPLHQSRRGNAQRIVDRPAAADHPKHVGALQPRPIE